ncbi:DUF2062 domain-containing protein [Ancylomarina sp. 16SWW S1-10-2]|uniref:DUF2062 domain-containing protein n=1 Tax=Ancylomarina sp. 16SWW S1-10-2 TaxID=2499681 RepID=UPI0012AE6821|nr:DUF2062 domain-containing protein [Ancylomarina sp. 16SWW S1-10-2]MRT93734.1 DUF2062 domain-containing protein [Ancylomarina sp. 16SWW S1-10-2]
MMNYQSVLRRLKLDKVKKAIVSEIKCADNTNKTIALSLALGVFLAFSPAWGFQTVLAISLALLFKLNKVLTLITVNISSLPPLIPLIIIAGYQAGALLLHGEFQKDMPDLMNIKALGENYLQFALGSLIVASGLGLFFYFTFHLILKKYRSN